MLSILLFGSLAVGLIASLFSGGEADPESLSYSEEDADGNTTMIGWDEADRISGTNHNDVIVGLAGDDSLDGGPGNDRIFDGEGDDVLRGRGGNDTLYGSESVTSDGETPVSGDDVLYGGAGADLLISTTGADTLYGGGGNDTIDGWSTSGSPNDGAVLVGDQGTDLVIGGAGDTLWGGSIDVADPTVDNFAVVAEGTNAGPAVIKDLDPDTESLFLFVPVPTGTTADPASLVTATRDSTDGLEVRIGGEFIALVEGVTVADNLELKVRILNV